MDWNCMETSRTCSVRFGSGISFGGVAARVVLLGGGAMGMVYVIQVSFLTPMIQVFPAEYCAALPLELPPYRFECPNDPRNYVA